MIPVSQDEPAVQVALTQALVKMIVGMPVAGGFILGHNLSAALSVFVAAFVAAAWSLAQGWLTRSKVFAPASVTGGRVGEKGPELMKLESPRQQVD